MLVETNFALGIQLN